MFINTFLFLTPAKLPGELTNGCSLKHYITTNQQQAKLWKGKKKSLFSLAQLSSAWFSGSAADTAQFLPFDLRIVWDLKQKHVQALY